MWRYGRGQPRRVAVAEPEQHSKASVANARKRAAETMKRRREERGEDYNSRRSQTRIKEVLYIMFYKSVI